jgi:hypothetical protein
MFEDETTIAWTALPRDTTVVGADGGEVGRVRYVLGDKEEDIFHGIAMRRAGDGATVEVQWSRVKRLTEEHVVTDLSSDDVESLPPYRER